MDGIRTDTLGEIDDLLHVEKAFDRTGPDEIGLVSLLDVNARGIGVGKDRGCGDIEFAAAADDPHGYFAAVGNQNFAEHVRLVRSPASVAQAWD